MTTEPAVTSEADWPYTREDFTSLVRKTSLPVDVLVRLALEASYRAGADGVSVNQTAAARRLLAVLGSDTR